VDSNKAAAPDSWATIEEYSLFDGVSLTNREAKLCSDLEALNNHLPWSI
jgi:hypothetical protein